MLKCALQINMKQIKYNIVRIPTDWRGRETNWLFTKRGGVEFGTTENKSRSELQVQRPNQ